MNLKYWPDPILNVKSEPVDFTEPLLKAITDEMLGVMYMKNGVGLSAIQLGIPKRIVVLDATKKGLKGAPEIWVNPRITYRSPEKELMMEGCLSLPGVFEEVSRAVSVFVEGYELDGSYKTTEAVGLRAQVFQHELEHLDGKIFVDRLRPGMKDRIRAQIRKSRGGFNG